MADYTPVFVPSRVITLTASEDLTGGDILVVSGSGAVGIAAADAEANHVGVAASDVTSGDPAALFARGYVHESVADGTVTAGEQLVTSGTAGRQVKSLADATGATAGDINNARAVIGVALTTAADGATVRWMQF